MGRVLEVDQPVEFPHIIWNGQRFEYWSFAEEKFIPAVVNKGSWIDSYLKAQKAFKKESKTDCIWFKHFSLTNGVLKLGFRSGTGITKRSWVYNNLSAVSIARYIKQAAKSFCERTTAYKTKKPTGTWEPRVESTDFNHWNERTRCFHTFRWPAGSHDDKLMEREFFSAGVWGGMEGARLAALQWQRAKGYWIRPYKARGRS